MKNILLVFGLVLSAFVLHAQDATAEYKATKEGWEVDLEKAYALSQETGKPIMANFTGSDWCIWCKRLDASVFSKEEFQKWASENVILLELDFPRRKKLPKKYKDQNYSLQQAFGIKGYPAVWLFNLTRNEELNKFNIEALGRSGYKKTVQEFVSEMESYLKS